MASSLALRRFLTSTVLPRSLRPAASSRLLNTNALRSYDDSDGDDFFVDPRYERSAPCRRDDFFSDVFDPFSRTRSNPVLSTTRARRGWDIEEKEDALHLRIDMPGLSREDVKLALEQDTLVIRGEEKSEDGEKETDRKFTSRIGLPEKIHKVDEIKAEMKNGVLKVVIAKMKEEERNIEIN